MWTYLVVAVIIGFMGWLQGRRGVVIGVVEVIGAYLGLWVAGSGAGPLAASVKIFGPQAGQVCFYVLLFVVWYAAFVAMSYAAERSSGFTMDEWDSVFGGLFGVVTGVFVCHVLFRAMLMATSPDSSLAHTLNHTWISREILYATSTKDLIHLGLTFKT